MTNNVAVVTGVGSGLGLELGLRLAQEYSVVGVSRRMPTDPRWSRTAAQGSVEHLAGDVSRSTTAAMVFERASALGQLRLLVNCAGQGVFGPAGSYTASDVEDVLRGNLVGTILFSEAAFNYMRTSGGGLIVNVMSTAAQVGRVNEAIYCASKWGARGYTESLRLEAKGTPVNVIAVYPGGMKTRFWQEAKGAKVDSSNFMPPEEVAESILDAIRARLGMYVSDVTINRK